MHLKLWSYVLLMAHIFFLFHFKTPPLLQIVKEAIQGSENQTAGTSVAAEVARRDEGSKDSGGIEVGASAESWVEKVEEKSVVVSDESGGLGLTSTDEEILYEDSILEGREGISLDSEEEESLIEDEADVVSKEWFLEEKTRVEGNVAEVSDEADVGDGVMSEIQRGISDGSSAVSYVESTTKDTTAKRLEVRKNP